jgi:hypothetical protein
VLDAIEGVALVYWLLGSAQGDPDAVAALHGPRLQRLLEEIVDTPVRAVVYEVTVGLDPEHAGAAFAALSDAGRRWRIPFEVVDAERAKPELWLVGMLAAASELVG